MSLVKKEYAKLYERIDELQADLVVIENPKNWKLELPKENPNSEIGLQKWREIKKKLIEGVFIKEFNKFRFVTGPLLSYINIGSITLQEGKDRVIGRPKLRDVDVMTSYEFLVGRGFSGWEFDDNNSSDAALNDEHVLKFVLENRNRSDSFSTLARYKSLLREDESLKNYIDPYENVKKLHDFFMGRPLYYNETSDVCIMGTRGGGKSAYIAAEITHCLLFNGAKYYDPNYKNVAEVCVGSGNSDKSSELCSKVETYINQLFIDVNLTYKTADDIDFEPNVFYKNFTGSLKPGNKKNPYIHKYKKKINGEWVDGFGTLAKLFHVAYSDKKQDGAEAAAGGRYQFSVVEEVGLTPNVIKIKESNDATIGVDGRFGVQAFIGTSGNMDLVEGAKELFLHPKTYNIISHKNIWEDGSDIGRFYPAYLSRGDFKTEEGNTKLREALEYFEREELAKEKSRNINALAAQRMNYPNIPSHMFITDRSKLLPSNEALIRIKDIIGNYKDLGTNVKLYFHNNTVEYEVDHEGQAFYDFDLKGNFMKNRSSIAGVHRIYHFPKLENGVVNPKYYFAVHDPFIGENPGEGDSLGTTYIIGNPEYSSIGIPGNQICATYIGRSSLEEYYLEQEKLLEFYGNCTLNYEANRGERVRSHYIRKNKRHILFIRPQLEVGDSIYKKRDTNYGYVVGNKQSKILLIRALNDWLLEDVSYYDLQQDRVVTKKVIETINCLFTLRQIELYNLDENFDGVSALLGAPLYLREKESNKIINQEATRNRRIILSDFKKLVKNDKRNNRR